MEKVTVTFDNGHTENYTPAEFVEAFKRSEIMLMDKDDRSYTPQSGREWAEAVDTPYAQEDWDDLYLTEQVDHNASIPSGCFIETGKELNDNTFDEDGNNVRPYEDDMYYITTDDGQDPVGGFKTEYEAIREARHMAEA